MSRREDEAAFEFVRLRARRLAREEGVTMVIGWQTNDDTGENVPGYCPLSVAGPCFVHTITETFEPPKGE
jgi:hypothetical protein